MKARNGASVKRVKLIVLVFYIYYILQENNPQTDLLK